MPGRSDHTDWAGGPSWAPTECRGWSWPYRGSGGLAQGPRRVDGGTRSQVQTFVSLAPLPLHVPASLLTDPFPELD